MRGKWTPTPSSSGTRQTDREQQVHDPTRSLIITSIVELFVLLLTSVPRARSTSPQRLSSTKQPPPSPGKQAAERRGLRACRSFSLVSTVQTIEKSVFSKQTRPSSRRYHPPRTMGDSHQSPSRVSVPFDSASLWLLSSAIFANVRGKSKRPPSGYRGD